MTTAIDPPDPLASHPVASDTLPGAASWRRIALLLLATLLAATIAAWFGYQHHVSPDVGAEAEKAAAPASATAANEAGGLNRGLGGTGEFVVGAAPINRSSSGLSWPLWEFRLRQPIPPRDPSLTPQPWRLIGSALSEGKWAVILLREGSTTPEYFTVGQELPGGYRIESINDEDVTLAQGKRLMVLSYIGSR